MWFLTRSNCLGERGSFGAKCSGFRNQDLPLFSLGRQSPQAFQNIRQVRTGKTSGVGYGFGIENHGALAMPIELHVLILSF